MFGGLAVMVDDRMLVCVGAGGGALLVRVSPTDEADLVGQPGARRAETGGGRSMGPGWVAVDAEGLRTEEELERWLAAALAFHATSTTTPRRRPAG